MNLDDLMVRRAVVLISAVVYWGGVWIQARRVQRHIGRSPNIKPGGLKERLLWLGWFLVVIAWVALPFVVQPESALIATRLCPDLLGSVSLALGLALVVAGYAGTLWCYASMGDRWRIGVDPNEKSALVTSGPYGRVRHPIYLFQIVMLLGAVALLPAWLPVLIIVVHLICVLLKALDEEAYLTRSLGGEYRAYLARTGRLLPPLWRRPRNA